MINYRDKKNPLFFNLDNCDRSTYFLLIHIPFVPGKHMGKVWISLVRLGVNGSFDFHPHVDFD